LATKSEVKLSSKGQIVLPKDARDRLGLKKGDRLKVQVDERTKSIILQPSVPPPEGVLVRAGTRFTSSILKKSDVIDDRKVKKLLSAIGVTQPKS